MSDRRPSSYARRLGQVVTKTQPAGAGPEHQEQQPMSPPTTATPEAPTRPSRRRGGERVRITVDLARDKHRGLRLFAVEADADASQVVRLLIDRLLRDPGFAEQVRGELEQG
jgi:hypothetical protein